MKVICIGGLPGSGKTFLAKKMLSECNYTLFDDINEETKKDLVKSLLEEKDIIITDPHFCLLDVRNKVEKWILEINPKYKIEWILFENDPLSCKSNVEFRNDNRKVEGLIHYLSSNFNSSEVNTILPVWKNSKNP